MTDDTAAPSASISDLSARELQRSVRARWSLRFGAIAGWLSFLGVWYLGSHVLLGTLRLPPPHVVAVEAWQIASGDGFGSTLWTTTVRVTGGLVLALLLSVAFGVVIAYSSWFRQLLNSFTRIFVAIPTVTLAILALILFGVSGLGPMFAATLVATPYVMSNVAQGLTSIDRRLIVMSESFGRTRAQIVGGVLVPSSVLAVIGGARQAFALAWRITVLTEIFASADGMGFQLKRSFESYDMRAMLAWTMWIVALMLISENLIFRQLERRMFGGAHAFMKSRR
ncbi:ABC transporter permease [Candidatus Poriferisodalis sp.]|uniref:ABC transporter permease n=1 Tax=Candidatus Poriferisodalis sp. TaxID=3101277 RepID=UPI003B01DC20